MPTAMNFGNVQGTTDFTKSINAIDNLYDFTGNIARFEERTTASKNITFDVTDKEIVVPDSSSWGAKNFQKGKESDVTPKSIFLDYIKLSDNITKDDFQDYRLPNTAGEMDTLTAVRMDKLGTLQDSLAQAMEFQRLSAMTGVTKNAYGKTICDSYNLVGATQDSVNLLLGTSTTEVGPLVNQAVRKSANAYRRGGMMPRPIAIVGETFFDKLISQANVKDAYAQYSSREEYLRNSQVQMQDFGAIQLFDYKSVTFIQYNPTFKIRSADGYATSTVKAFGDDEGYLLPAGAPDFLRSYFGPSQRLDSVGGNKFHAYEFMSEDRETWNMNAEHSGLHFCTAPQSIIKLTTN